MNHIKMGSEMEKDLFKLMNNSFSGKTTKKKNKC